MLDRQPQYRLRIDADRPEALVEDFLALMRAPLPDSSVNGTGKREGRLGLLAGFLAGLAIGLAGFMLAMSVEPDAPIGGECRNCRTVEDEIRTLQLATPAATAGDRRAPPLDQEELGDADLPPLAPLEGRPWDLVRGLLQFRGNPTHTYYGEGPVPVRPRVLWRFPDRPMCSNSEVNGDVTEWCGTGWTGEPVVWERPDGVTEIIIGAYDNKVHFIDAQTGKRTRPDFVTGDLVKGSITLDPDGFPLLYFGSRDNKLRIVALDRDRPTELWQLDAYAVPGLWNDDWDGNPSVIDDIMYEGGENSYFFAVQLNRDYDERGFVKVSPEMLIQWPGWTAEEIKAVGDIDVSIENSVAVFRNRVYFTNSGGRVVGLDLRRVREKLAPVVFDFWAGDDIDASVVVDGEGMLYVAAELERFLPRALELGQFMKLNPYNPADPVVWSVKVPPAPGDKKGGIWATPALGKELVFVPTHSGRFLGVDRMSGQVVFNDEVGWHAWSSPVIVDDNLLVATCTGEIRNYSISNPRQPVPVWSFQLKSGACIESTPAVWKGRLYVGARDGYIYAIGD